MSLPTDPQFVQETLTLLSQATEKLRLLSVLMKPGTVTPAKVRKAQVLLGLIKKRRYRRLAPTSKDMRKTTPLAETLSAR